MSYRVVVRRHVWTVAVAVLVPVASAVSAPSVLVNPGFEEESDGSVAGWTILNRLDGNKYGEPQFNQTFDAIEPVQGLGGFQSRHCLSFPREGTWKCPVWAHSNGNNRGVNGKALGKAAAYQTVSLDPGRYRFTARLRTAAGHLHAASFSLGVSLSATADYRHDGSSGITWTRDLARRRSETGGKEERGEWTVCSSAPFELRETGPVTVWIRFDYANENQFETRWQADDAAIVPDQVVGDGDASVRCACEPVRQPVRLREFCGDVETYLVESGGSRVVEAPEVRLQRHARELQPGDKLRYRFPSPPDAAHLLLRAAGELSVVVGNQALGFRSEPTEPATYEWPLTVSASGTRQVEVVLEARGALPSRIYELELGSPARTSVRVAHVTARTVAVPWRVGTWDGSDAELAIGSQRPEPRSQSGDEATVWRLRVPHDPRAGHRYWFVYGLVGGTCEIDVGGDGIVDWIARTTGEEIVDVDVTEMLKPGENPIAVTTAGRHDFAALAETCPGCDDLRDAQLVFEGDALAETVSRTAANTWFWLRELHYEPTGFVDASIPFGKWFNQYWPIDTAFALREWVGWGFQDEALQIARFSARRGWKGDASNRSGGHDNTGGNILVRQFCELIARADYEAGAVDELWGPIRDHAAGVIKAAESSPYGLVRGTNWENAGNLKQGPCYALSTSLGGALSLRQAALVADRLGKSEEARAWRSAAGRIRGSVLKHLLLGDAHRCPSGFEMPAGTWAYGLRMDGSVEDQPLAGYFWAGAGLCEAEGLMPTDREVLDAYDRTLAAALPLFDRGEENVVSGYATSYDGPDVSLVLAALCDRISALHPLVEHSARACGAGDPISATRAELSPWTVGKGGWVEDTNLVGAAGFLWPLRAMAGIDDSASEDRGQLALVPRLPWQWSGIRVNDWPVRCRDAAGRDRWRKLSYELRRNDETVTLRVWADGPIPGVRVRLGPFASTVAAIRVSGADGELPSQATRAGDAAWALCQLDVAREPATVTASPR